MPTSFRRIWTYAAIILSFVVVLSAIIAWHMSTLSATLTITAVPLSSKVTVNGQSAREGVNRTKPGTKKVVVSMDGFSTITQTIVVNKGENKSVDIVLTSNSSKTSNWYLTHPKDETAAEGVSSRNNDALSNQSQTNAPLIKLLPFVAGGLEFRVDYGNKPNTNGGLPVIYITSPTQKGQQDGLAWIKSIGYDPAEYKIELVTGQVQPLNP